MTGIHKKTDLIQRNHKLKSEKVTKPTISDKIAGTLLEVCNFQSS